MLYVIFFIVCLTIELLGGTSTHSWSRWDSAVVTLSHGINFYLFTDGK